MIYDVNCTLVIYKLIYVTLEALIFLSIELNFEDNGFAFKFVQSNMIKGRRYDSDYFDTVACNCEPALGCQLIN